MTSFQPSDGGIGISLRSAAHAIEECRPMSCDPVLIDNYSYPIRVISDYKPITLMSVGRDGVEGTEDDVIFHEGRIFTVNHQGWGETVFRLFVNHPFEIFAVSLAVVVFFKWLRNSSNLRGKRRG